MEGMFESYPATFIFGFYKNKIMSSKAVYLQSMGNAERVLRPRDWDTHSQYQKRRKDYAQKRLDTWQVYYDYADL